MASTLKHHTGTFPKRLISANRVCAWGSCQTTWDGCKTRWILQFSGRIHKPRWHVGKYCSGKHSNSLGSIWIGSDWIGLDQIGFSKIGSSFQKEPQSNWTFPKMEQNLQDFVEKCHAMRLADATHEDGRGVGSAEPRAPWPAQRWDTSGFHDTSVYT